MFNTLSTGTVAVCAPVLSALAIMGSVSAAQAEVIGPDFADMVERVLPAVVHVSVESRQYGVDNRRDGMPGQDRFGPFERFNPFDMPGMPEGRPDGRDAPRAIMGSGSGFIIDPAGYVVTNNHVIDGAEVVQITLADGGVYEASLVGTDPSTDIAVLKIEGEDTFPYVEWGDSDALRIGNWVVAAGGPFGLMGTVTAGIVSATDRDLRAGPYDDFLQFDAQINPGNSGGPVFDTDGAVIGVSTAIVSPSRGSVGIGFAVPAAMASNVVASIIDDGSVERGFLGVQIQHVTEELADALGLDDPYGALVAEVYPDTPADRAGILPGDLIVSFNGERIDAMRELPRLVGLTDPGTESEVEVLRDGELVTLAVTLGDMDADAPQTASLPPSGAQTMDRLGFAAVSAEDYGWTGEDGQARGVVVVNIRENSTADKSGLQVGDVILAIRGKSIDTPEQLADELEAAQEDNRTVALLVEREGERQFMALPLDAS